MLEGLDRIDWDSLEDAYGDADSVPEMIRAIASEDPVARAEAYDDLFGSILHQGTVYEASAVAVPFLLEVLAQPAGEDLPHLLGLLGAMSRGQGYQDRHRRVLDEPMMARMRFRVDAATERGWAAATEAAVSRGAETIAVFCSSRKWRVPLVG